MPYLLEIRKNISFFFFQILSSKFRVATFCILLTSKGCNMLVQNLGFSVSLPHQSTLGGGVWVGRKKGWQDTALILPSVQTRCQGKDVSPWGKKISPHPEPVIPTFWQNKSKGIKLGCSYNHYSDRVYLELSLYRVGWRKVNLR